VPQLPEHVGQEPLDAVADARRLRLPTAGDVQDADLILTARSPPFGAQSAWAGAGVNTIVTRRPSAAATRRSIDREWPS
jgi:hypothetical protein